MFAGDIYSLDAKNVRGGTVREVVDALENLVDLAVPMSADPPSFHDTVVVAMDKDVGWGW